MVRRDPPADHHPQNHPPYTLRGMPAGQPPRLIHVHRIDPETGEVETVADAIVRYVRKGNYLETVAHLVGVNKGTIGQWLRDGAAAHDRILTGAKRRDLTAHQRRCLDLARNVRQAMAESESEDVVALGQLAHGGIPQVKTVTVTEAVRDADGEETSSTLVRTTTTVTHSLPDARALTWRLTRRFPQRWQLLAGDADELAADDADELALDDPTAVVEAALKGINRRKTEVRAQLVAAGINPDEVIEATVVDTPNGHRPTDPGDSPL